MSVGAGALGKKKITLLLMQILFTCCTAVYHKKKKNFKLTANFKIKLSVDITSTYFLFCPHPMPRTCSEPMHWFHI